MCVCVCACVCARENSSTAASHNASVKAASNALGSSCLPPVSALPPRPGRRKHVEMSGPPLQWLGHEEFELDVVRALRFGRWREALVGQVLRCSRCPGAARDSIAGSGPRNAIVEVLGSEALASGIRVVGEPLEDGGHGLAES